MKRILIKTRYRDVPWEEIVEAHPGYALSPELRARWEPLRGKLITLTGELSSRESWGPLAVRGGCDQPNWEVIEKYPHAGIAPSEFVIVCPHLAEIGD